MSEAAATAAAPPRKHVIESDAVSVSNLISHFNRVKCCGSALQWLLQLDESFFSLQNLVMSMPQITYRRKHLTGRFSTK